MSAPDASVTIYVLTAHAEPEMSFTDFAELYKSMYQQPRFIVIFDLRFMDFTSLPWGHLPDIIAMLQQLRPQTQKQLVASVCISTSTIINYLIPCITQQYPMCSPFKAVDTPEAAAAYIHTYFS